MPCGQVVHNKVYLTVINDQAGPITYARAGHKLTTVKDRIRCKGSIIG